MSVPLTMAEEGEAGCERESLAAYSRGKLSLKDFEWPQSLRVSFPLVYSDSQSIPEIDLQALLGQQNDKQQQQLQLLSEAVSTCGFFQVVNHPIPASAIRCLDSHARKFFSSPLQRKLELAKAFGRMMTEFDIRPGYTCGSPLESPLKLWYEALLIAASDKDNVSAVAKCLCADEEEEYTFKDALEKFSFGFTKLARDLCTILLETLGLDANEILEEYVDGNEQGVGVKLLHYPPCPQPEKTAGLPEHTDICLLTVLWQDEVGGLQVCQDGCWITVKPNVDAMVVNIGDIFQVCSNDRFKSGLHRVALNKNESRYSIASFYNPRRDFKLTPLPQLLDSTNEAAKFRSMIPVEYRKLTFKETFNGAWQGVNVLRC
ncbi:hypothetical protein KP509_31G033200 [Ceratopteris richardii]|uniref:Fe2OG dioxygenase domain-containing protein n=1 Tax=Ceratopteris richardii TaxID=49495 RepID=A0A8T2QYP1_CERRI|nr:hypothetical protein KP509_31G033200 [Ceratopteris richardii]